MGSAGVGRRSGQLPSARLDMDRVASVGEDAERLAGRVLRGRPPHSGRQPVGVRGAGPVRAHDEFQIPAGDGFVELAPMRPVGSGPAGEIVVTIAVEEPVRERTGLFRVAGVPEPHAKGGPVAAPADLRVDPVSGTRPAAPRGLRHAAGRPVQDLLLRQVLRIRRVQVPVARILAPEGALAGNSGGCRAAVGCKSCRRRRTRAGGVWPRTTSSPSEWRRVRRPKGGRCTPPRPGSPDRPRWASGSRSAGPSSAVPPARHAPGRRTGAPRWAGRPRRRRPSPSRSCRSRPAGPRGPPPPRRARWADFDSVAFIFSISFLLFPRRSRSRKNGGEGYANVVSRSFRRYLCAPKAPMRVRLDAPLPVVAPKVPATEPGSASAPAASSAGLPKNCAPQLPDQ